MNPQPLDFRFRGLYLSEWYGVWLSRVQRRLCRLRGHQWGDWMFEACWDVGQVGGDSCRMCDRCDAHELRDHERVLYRSVR